jgi:cytochrome d ubiquinol oxidase subunit I
VLAVNAWMNAPSGFRIVDGEVTDVNPWAAMFNEAVFLQFLHMWLAAFMVVGFVVAGVYAYAMRRGRDDEHHRLGFVVPFAFASIAAVLQPMVGHFAGQSLAGRQPEKLAAMELLEEGRRHAPLTLGGAYRDGRVAGGVEVPGLASFLAGNSTDTFVPGINDVPVDERPPANIVHWSFQLMVGIGTASVALVAWFWWQRRHGRDPLGMRRFLGLAVLAGGASVVALQAGWITTEVGRQPWIVYRVLLVRDAASHVGGALWVSFGVMIAVYVAMGVAALVVLRSMARRWRQGDSLDLPTPYSPPERVLEVQRS